MTSPVLWYATRATGIVALVLFTATVGLGALTASRAQHPSWPGFAQQELHRRVSLLAMAFLAVHIVTSVLDSYVHIGLVAVFVPFVSHYKAAWVGVGTVALDMMLAVAITSLVRHRIPAGAWRAVHWLGYLSWPVALAHGIAIGTDRGEGWVAWLVVACVASVVVAVAGRTAAAIRWQRTANALVPATVMPATRLAPRPARDAAPGTLAVARTTARRTPRRDP